MSVEQLKAIARTLHEINFGKDGIIHPVGGGIDYDFSAFLKNKTAGHKGHYFNDFTKCACIECDAICEKKSLLVPPSENSRFTYVAHGAHTIDFLAAHFKDCHNLEKWSHKPVMFLLENPSNDSGNEYWIDGESCGQKRFPSSDWFWLNSSGYSGVRPFSYPNYFTMGEYGKMIYSVMQTFHIANGYVTDSVKCGIGEDKDRNKITSTSNYNPDIIKTCVQKYLQKEVQALRLEDNQPVIIFAFGENAYNNALNYLEDDNVYLFQLPHPAHRQLSNEYRKYILFGKIAKVLLQSNFYKDVEAVNILSALQCDQFDSIPELKYSEDTVKKAIIACATEAGLPCVCKNGYLKGKLTYHIEKLNRSIVRQLVIRYKPTVKEHGYQSFWTRYNFAEDYIDFWCGTEENKSDECVEDAAEARRFRLYNFAELLVKELKALRKI